MMDKSTRQLKTLLADIMQKHNLEAHILDYYLQMNWPKIVGLTIAKQCTPQRIADNTLFIKVKNPVWKSELASREHELVNLITQNATSTRIHKIIFS